MFMGMYHFLHIEKLDVYYFGLYSLAPVILSRNLSNSLTFVAISVTEGTPKPKFSIGLNRAAKIRTVHLHG